VVPAHPRGRRPVSGGRRQRALALLAVVALAVAGCARDGARTLPADRQAPVVYVALGDSTVEGVGASRPDATYVAHLHERLRAVYPAARVANLGVAGATSADVLGWQLEPALRAAPQLVTVSVGPNDVTGGVAVEQYEANMDAVFGTLRGRTGAVLVATLLPDIAVTPRFRHHDARDVLGRTAVAYNDALRRLAKRHRVDLVDLHTPSRAEVPARPELVAADGYHPSDAGYARWAELVWPAIERRIGRAGR
jgi:acyl-CoA thioesterase I